MMPNEPVILDVAVIGLGPCGAIATGLLGQAGLNTLACDRTRALSDLPRALALDHQALRVLQELSLAERVEPWIAPFTSMEHYGAQRQLIRRMVDVDPPFPLGYPPSIVFLQPPVEHALRERLRELPNVNVALGEELIGLSQHEDRVLLTLRNESGSERNLEARYVVACDGASSTARRLLDIELEDLGFDEPWLVADVLVNESGLAKIPSISTHWCEPSRPCWYVVGVRNHRRWQFALNPGEDPQLIETPEATWRLLSRWITPYDGQLWRQACYRFRGLVAKELQRGRVFLAGDAAHQQPPFLGQGLCQGIRDVANLAWKLTAVLQGRAKPSLLETYGDERREHARQLIMLLKSMGTLISERDPDRARARDARLTDAGVTAVVRQEILPKIGTGLLSTAVHPANGTPFPQPWILKGGVRARLDDVVGSGWRLVYRDGDRGFDVPEGQRSRLRLCIVRFGIRSDQVCELDGVLRDWFRRYDCFAALVRPDHYVYGAASNVREVAAMFSDLDTRLTALQ